MTSFLLNDLKGYGYSLRLASPSPVIPLGSCHMFVLNQRRTLSIERGRDFSVCILDSCFEVSGDFSVPLRLPTVRQAPVEMTTIITSSSRKEARTMRVFNSKSFSSTVLNYDKFLLRSLLVQVKNKQSLATMIVTSSGAQRNREVSPLSPVIPLGSCYMFVLNQRRTLSFERGRDCSVCILNNLGEIDRRFLHFAAPAYRQAGSSRNDDNYYFFIPNGDKDSARI